MGAARSDKEVDDRPIGAPNGQSQSCFGHLERIESRLSEEVERANVYKGTEYHRKTYHEHHASLDAGLKLILSDFY
ncbi:hypothetical protein EVAR_4068_1 [Eumeta japonica]|uniref:Uncharacterized protein n=1 Tax=Eumeta variegata TaxID=151549 RepID=A0A4C1T4S0_EUMVA|nr:hypothetical protein EVAR_4068_1 [Eumeta japonica]